MNCKQITHLLDRSESSELSAADTIAINSHAVHCAACAAQVRVSRAMAAFRSEVPELPASLQERARCLQSLCDTTARERRSRRPVLIGSLLLLGAAASLFTPVQWRDASATHQ